MKLFKSLLVAPATLGLLAPMSVTANELNLTEVSGYSSSEEVQSISEFNSTQLAVTNSRVDGLEARLNNFEAGSFSETTTATFSADFAIGAVDGDADEDAVQALYGFQIDLNTSFTGDDSLDVSIDAGNGGSDYLSELDLNKTTANDVLAVDGISYTFPVGDNLTVLVGNDVAGSSLYNTACVYSGITNTLDDCGNASSAMDVSATSTAGSTALSASYDFGDGFTAAFGYEGSGETSAGLMTKEAFDTYGLQVSYEDEDGQFGGSLTYALEETSATAETTYWGLNAYWTPEDVGAVPSISVGYEIGNPSASSNDTTHWFLGFQWDEVGDGTLGAAVGTDQHYADNVTEYLMYEAFYSYPINDGMTVTPVIYVKETSGDDQTGVMVKTSFSF